ncbi:alpha/beta fold hydrolase [Methylobacterium marchantiae]|uniref:Alpha/beta fold hydrolase n=1 Tax=Methylobacterium marchantiae TaxID=600331 RepID=A0ABW3X1S2_9HYPH|nr:2-hydroxy-6-oxononadienedioate/2-hydroxy-6-oxononatrienedioate hydrolase [Methylobacterium marchantiae]
MILLHWLGLIAAAIAGLIVSVLAAGALVTLIVTARVAARFPPQGPFVEVAGGRLATIEAGPNVSDKGTVVLLHGASANAADPMEGVGRRLAGNGFRVIAFDRPGFGWSDRLGGREMASPAAQGHAIAQALERLNTGPVILLGHSWSGTLASAIALDHPKLVSGLVLVAPVAMPFSARDGLPWYYRLALKPPMAWLLGHTVATPLGLYYLRPAARAVFRPQDLPDDYLERSRSALVLRPDTMLANLYDLIGLPAAVAAQAPRYGSIAMPTVIVAGDADAAVPADRQAEPLAKVIPDARLVLLPGIGHMVPYVATEALVDEVEGLADRIAAPGREPVAR